MALNLIKSETEQVAFSVIIADDHMLVRQSLRNLLESASEFEIVGEAEDGVEALSLSKMHQPDLLILDAAMPKATGIEVIEEVRRWCRNTRIAVVTGVNSAGYLQQILESQVDGLFLKSGDTASWVKDFLAICSGETRISERATMNSENSVRLSGRERQILFCISRGETNRAISDRLGISASTVDKHRTSIMRKLNVHSVAALVSKAFRDGLLSDSSLDNP